MGAAKAAVAWVNSNAIIVNIIFLFTVKTPLKIFSFFGLRPQNDRRM
jgi:hypothetical protein